MMLFECLTSYVFKYKHIQREVNKHLHIDCIVLERNSIYAFIFFNSINQETYTIFVVNDKAYAGLFFNQVINIHGSMDKLKSKLKEKGYDCYDLFLFQVGTVTAETYGVKIEAPAGNGTITQPLEIDSDSD